MGLFRPRRQLGPFPEKEVQQPISLFLNTSGQNSFLIIAGDYQDQFWQCVAL